MPAPKQELTTCLVAGILIAINWLHISNNIHGNSYREPTENIQRTYREHNENIRRGSPWDYPYIINELPTSLIRQPPQQSLPPTMSKS